MKYQIDDDSGFMGLIDNNTYFSFVDEDWSFDQLMNHLKNEMKKHSLLIWGTGSENTWNIEVNDNFSEKTGFREIIGNIVVTNKELFLINYESLSMAAQFKHVKLPENHMKDLKIELENGEYLVRIVQLKDPIDEKLTDEYDFLIEFKKTKIIENEWDKIPWRN